MRTMQDEGMMQTMDDLDQTVLSWLQKIGGPSLIRRMLDLFLEHTPKRLETARLGLQTGDFEAVERAAHSLKSSAGHLGIAVLQEAAENLEQAARARQEALLAPCLQEIEGAAVRLMPLLQHYRSTLKD